MRHCNKCAVTVNGDMEKCPLCQNTLTGEAEGSGVFPYIPIAIYEYNRFYRILLLLSAVAVIASLTVNWMLPSSGFWSLFITAGVLSAWISIFIAIRKRHNILKNLAYQVTAVSIGALLWDVFTGWHGWSIDYVMPIAFISAMTATAVLAYVLKMRAGDYITYMFLLILYGIIPVVFVLSGLCTVVYPSLTCVASSLVSLTAMFVFEGRNMIEELNRRLHV